MSRLDALFEDMASIADTLTDAEVDRVARQDFKRNRTSVPEAYDRLGSIIRAKNGVEDFRQIMLEALRGYAPAILVEHDGGGSLEGVALVDTDTSEVLGDGLHERFFEYLYRSGRMSP